MPDHPLQQQTQLFQVERLGDVIVGAVLHRLHRRLHGGVAGDDDDHGFRTAALDLAQHLQPAGPRQPQIQQHHVDPGGLQDAIGMFGVIRNIGGEADRLRDFAASVPNGPLVVDDQQVQQIRLGLGRIRHGRFSSKHISDIRFQNGSDFFPKWHCPRHFRNTPPLRVVGCRRTSNHNYRLISTVCHRQFPRINLVLA